MKAVPVSKLSVTEGLILVRITLAGEGGETTGAIRKDVIPIIARHLAKSQQDQMLKGTMQALLEGQFIEPAPTSKTRQRATSAGREEALKFLEIDDLPPKTSWAKLRDRVLVARALGLNAGSPRVLNHVSKSDGLRAMALLNLFGSSPASSASANLLPTLAQATDMLAAAQLGTSRSGVAELRNALLARWIGSQQPEPQVTVPASAGSEEQTEEEFAKAVIQAAKRSPAERFGDDKVLLVYAWRQYSAEHPGTKEGITHFKQRVLEAQRKGLIDLSRADLVEAMNPQDVLDSEIGYLGTRFHFIRI